MNNLYSTGRPRKYDVGTKLGNLTICARSGNRIVAECDCGNTIEVTITAVTQGGKRDCGCRAAKAELEELENPFSASGNMLYWTWTNMIARCEDEHNPHYANYGGRGIRVCPRWKEDFATFASDLGERPPGMTLDRWDNDGNYEPSNCRWATPQQQAQNRREREKKAKQSSKSKTLNID